MAVENVKPKVFKYEKPEFDHGKAMVWLARSDIVWGLVQVVKEGGETNLHSHSAVDGFWMVLSGRARFYGEGDQLIAELGKYEGVLIPRGAKYWFESAGDEPAEILQVAGFVKGEKEQRTDYTPPKSQSTVLHLGDSPHG